jgi:ABC-2 type transport system permease protein
MMNTLKAEFKKLLSVRSTYIIIILSLVIVIFYAGYIQGFRASQTDILNRGLLASEVTGAVGIITVLFSIIALLLFAHEYRYNTIMYSLTSSNSRSKVLLSKILAITVFSVIFTVFIGVFSPLMTAAGLHLKGLHLVPQTLHYGSLLWTSLLYGWGYSMWALVIVALIRNQVGSIVVFFIVPGSVESLLGLLLKNNVKYLPFTALQGVLNDPDNHRSLSTLTPGRSAIVAVAYLVGAWIVAWVLFLRRDAN